MLAGGTAGSASVDLAPLLELLDEALEVLLVRVVGSLSQGELAFAALGFAASIGCIPSGAAGFGGLALGVLAGGAPVLASRRAAT